MRLPFLVSRFFRFAYWFFLFCWKKQKHICAASFCNCLVFCQLRKSCIWIAAPSKFLSCYPFSWLRYVLPSLFSLHSFLSLFFAFLFDFFCVCVFFYIFISFFRSMCHSCHSEEQTILFLGWKAAMYIYFTLREKSWPCSQMSTVSC